MHPIAEVNLSERQRIAVELLGDIDWQSKRAALSNVRESTCTPLLMASVTARSTSIMCQRFIAFTIIVAESWTELTTNSVQGSARRNTSSLVKLPNGKTRSLCQRTCPLCHRSIIECLPETLCPWIKDIAERMQCPPDFPAVGAMIALGSVLGRKIGIRPKRRDDWLEIANLWGCIIARPGLLKTPALQQALVLLRRLIAKAWERYEQELREHDISEILRVQRKKILEEDIRKDLKAKKEADAKGKVEKHLDAAHDKPVCRRYEVNDSTIPKLGELLAENPNGLLLVRDELSGLLRELDNEEHAGDRAKYLEMWDGKGELTYDRIGRGTVRVPSNTLSILGGIQPDVVTPYVREAVRGGTGNDGLLQRIQLFVWPDVSKEWRNVDEWPDTEAKNQAFAVFEYLDKLTPETSRRGQFGRDSFPAFYR